MQYASQATKLLPKKTPSSAGGRNMVVSWPRRSDLYPHASTAYLNDWVCVLSSSPGNVPPIRPVFILKLVMPSRS